MVRNVRYENDQIAISGGVQKGVIDLMGLGYPRI